MLCASSASCELARKNIHIDGLKIPDSFSKSGILKVPLEGDRMFTHKLQDITNKSFEII